MLTSLFLTPLASSVTCGALKNAYTSVQLDDNTIGCCGRDASAQVDTSTCVASKEYVDSAVSVAMDSTTTFEGRCTLLAKSGVSASSSDIASTVYGTTAAGNSYCIVRGVMRGIGQLRFQINIPQAWNQHYYQQTCAGTCGDIAALDQTWTDAGYMDASVTESNFEGFNFWNNAQMERRSLFSGGGQVRLTPIAKSITEYVTGQNIVHSIASGCSHGGATALALAKELPGEFDILIPMDPALDWGNLQRMSGWLLLAKYADSVPSSLIMKASSIVKSYCDQVDGIADGQSDLKCIGFDASAHACVGETTAICFSASEVETLAPVLKIEEGYKDWNGQERYKYNSNIMLSTSGSTATTSDPRRVIATWGVDTPSDAAEFYMNYDDAWNLANTSSRSSLLATAFIPYLTRSDVEQFIGNGGVLLTTVGTHDSLISARMIQHMYESWDLTPQEKMKIQLLPRVGAGHCVAMPAMTDFVQYAISVHEGNAPAPLSVNFAPPAWMWWYSPAHFAMCPHPAAMTYDSISDEYGCPPPSPPTISPALCQGDELTLTLLDAYGDGWNGGSYLTVGTTNYTMSQGSETVKLACVETGVCTEMVYHGIGSWHTENSLKISINGQDYVQSFEDIGDQVLANYQSNGKSGLIEFSFSSSGGFGCSTQYKCTYMKEPETGEYVPCDAARRRLSKLKKKSGDDGKRSQTSPSPKPVASSSVILPPSVMNMNPYPIPLT